MTFSAPFSRVITRPFGGVPALGTALKTNLVAYWTLNESSDGSGAVSRLDSSGNTNTLTDINTTPSGTGVKGNSAYFTSTNSEFLERPSTASLLMSDIDFTIAFWANRETSTGTAYLISKGVSTSSWGNMAYRSYINNSGTLYWQIGANTSNSNVSKSVFDSNGVWYFIVMYHDSVNNKVGISVNAGEATTADWTGGCVDSEMFIQKISSVPANPATYQAGFSGMMDEIGIWKRMLTASEITWLYNAGAGRTYSEF